MDIRVINEKYAKIGKYLIDNVPELNHLDGENIIYLSSTAEKKAKRKMVLGECEKVQEKNKWAIPCDFTITLFEPNIQGLQSWQVAVVIWHELLHVGVDDDTRYILPHDLNDFKSIVDHFGTDWNKPGASCADAIALMAAKAGEEE